LNTKQTAALSIVILGFSAASAQAHFKLHEPASWIEEDERGDPQKLAPCGGTLADGGTRTGAVTEVQGGQMLRIVAEETIYHPGFFRIALARRPNWLPDDPVATMKQTEQGPRSASGAISSNPQPPVLVDGLWLHHERFTGMRETEIEVPNIDCENCFLQVIQFMESHPGVREGDFSYHHCAVLNITADQALPLTEGW
jgi:hypothetical protein